MGAMKRVPRSAAVVLFAAAVAASLALTAPAQAQHRNESGGLCESFGNWCTGGSSSANGAGVLEVGSPGRGMQLRGDGSCWNSPYDSGGCMTTGTLVFTALSNKCADDDTANPTYVQFGPCSGVSGVRWAEVVGSHHQFINVWDTSRSGITSDQKYSGPNCGSPGCDIRVISAGQSGWSQNWDFK